MHITTWKNFCRFHFLFQVGPWNNPKFLFLCSYFIMDDKKYGVILHGQSLWKLSLLIRRRLNSMVCSISTSLKDTSVFPLFFYFKCFNLEIVYINNLLMTHFSHIEHPSLLFQRSSFIIVVNSPPHYCMHLLHCMVDGWYFFWLIDGKGRNV